MENIDRALSNYRLPIALSALGLVLIVGGIYSSRLMPVLPKRSTTLSQNSQNTTQIPLSTVKVDVSGAVSRPGVINLEPGARVEDAIKFAGGFSYKADREYVSKKLNLSQKISDGMKIYIPFEGENYAHVISPGTVAGLTVNLNNATREELEALPGIGSVTASKIIAGRPYAGVDELVDRKIVSRAVFAKISALLSAD